MVKNNKELPEKVDKKIEQCFYFELVPQIRDVAGSKV